MDRRWSSSSSIFQKACVHQGSDTAQQLFVEVQICPPAGLRDSLVGSPLQIPVANPLGIQLEHPQVRHRGSQLQYRLAKQLVSQHQQKHHTPLVNRRVSQAALQQESHRGSRVENLLDSRVENPLENRVLTQRSPRESQLANLLVIRLAIRVFSQLVSPVVNPVEHPQVSHRGSRVENLLESQVESPLENRVLTQRNPRESQLANLLVIRLDNPQVILPRNRPVNRLATQAISLQFNLPVSLRHSQQPSLLNPLRHLHQASQQFNPAAVPLECRQPNPL